MLSDSVAACASCRTQDGSLRGVWCLWRRRQCSCQPSSFSCLVRTQHASILVCSLRLATLYRHRDRLGCVHARGGGFPKRDLGLHAAARRHRPVGVSVYSCNKDYLKCGVHSYPAGFVYVYSALYHLTEKGSEVWLAQCVFGVLYLCNLSVVLAIYCKVAKVSASPSYSIPPSPCLSHSDCLQSCFFSWAAQRTVCILYLFFVSSMTQWLCFSSTRQCCYS